MDRISIIIHSYVISYIDRINWCVICFFLYIELSYSFVIICMVNYFCWMLMRLYLFTYYVFINYFIIFANTWLCICFFLQRNECIQCTLLFNIDIIKVLITYDIINVWCIQMTWFATVDVWVNSSTSPLLRNVKNVPSFFRSWRRKLHNYLI